MFAKEIESIFTQKVAEFIQKGYTFNVSTMRGSQGEIAKVDLCKGDEIIRIMLANDVDCGDCIRDCITLTVGRNTESLRSRRCFDSSKTIWNNRLEIIEQRKFFKVGSDDEYFIEDESEIEEIENKRHERFVRRSKRVEEVELPREKAAAIVLGWVRKQPRCKSVKLGEIEKVARIVTHSTFDGSYEVRFVVTVRGAKYTIK